MAVHNWFQLLVNEQEETQRRRDAQRDAEKKAQDDQKTDYSKPFETPVSPMSPEEFEQANGIINDLTSKISPLVNKYTPPGFYNDYLNSLLQSDKPWQHENEDLVRGDKNLNLNGMNYNRTQALGKFADVLNNRLYIEPSDIGARGASKGGAPTGSPIGIGRVYQMPKLETDETRQRDRLAKREETTLTSMINRKEAFRNQSEMLNRMQQLQQLHIAGKLTEAELEEWKSLYDNVMYQRFYAPYEYRQAIQRIKFERMLSELDIKGIQINKIRELYDTGYSSLATISAEVYTGVTSLPSPLNRVTDWLLQPLSRALIGGNPAEIDAALRSTIDNIQELLQRIQGPAPAAPGTPE